MAIFSTVGLAYYNNYNQETKLKSDAKKLVGIIELSKKKAYSSALKESCSDFSGSRVTINAGSYSFSFGCGGSYETVQSYSFSTSITATIGTGNLDFKPLGLGTNLTINSIRLKNSIISQCLDITISPIGIVEMNETLFSC